MILRSIPSVYKIQTFNNENRQILSGRTKWYQYKKQTKVILKRSCKTVMYVNTDTNTLTHRSAWRPTKTMAKMMRMLNKG